MKRMVRYASKALILFFIVLCSSCGFEDSGSYASGTISNSNSSFCMHDVEETILSESTDLDVDYVSQLPNYCGPASLSMVLEYHGYSVDQETIGDGIVGSNGVSTTDLKTKTEEYGLYANVVSCDSSINNLLDIVDRLEIPVIVRVLNSEGRGHFIVVTGYDRFRDVVFVNDPNDFNKDEIPFDDFEGIWAGNWMIIVRPVA